MNQPASIARAIVGAPVARLLFLGLAFVTASSGSQPPATPPAATHNARAVVKPIWSPAALVDLLAAVEASSAEGLDPAAYSALALRKAVTEQSTGHDIDRLADDAALALAHDYLLGRIDARQRLDWHIAGPSATPAQLALLVRAAREQGRLREWLEGLLPTDERYRALRDALAATAPGDVARQLRIRANMERWRWMPRDLGAKHLYVNIPSYRVAVVEDGVETADYVAVVGARDTPTPAINAVARAVVVNPWWNVPTSIIEKGEVRPGRRASRRGYVFKTSESGEIRVRQKPGPQNALGRIKIEMPNAHAIYMHDTPAKALFARDERAFSHGCIRVQQIDELAERLRDDGRVGDALAGDATRTLPLAEKWPVYIVYFTLDADPAGALTEYPDIYDRDGQLVAMLDGTDRPRVQVASLAAAR